MFAPSYSASSSETERKSFTTPKPDKRDDARPTNRASQNVDDNDVYAKKKFVEKSLGKSQKLKIIGFVLTKETFGARVELSEEQVPML